jgi:RNA polymerase sigma-70 factor (ECF subfamily)
MAPNPSFDDLMARLRTGDDEAAAQVFNRFANRLIVLARQRLGPRIRQKLDPEDVLQSVFRSFFVHQAAGQITGLESWDSLWAMLVVITLRKCGRQIKFYRSASRDVRREIPVLGADSDSSSDGGTSSDEPTPSEAAMLAETVEQLMNDLDERHRAILTLGLQGFSARDISEKLHCTERMAYRVLDRVKEKLQALRNEEEQDV